MNSFFKIKWILFLIMWAQLSNASVGGWTSGGGELIRDQQNPWFVQNTKQVNYCILIDEVAFGQSKAFVAQNIKRVFDFWKMQMTDLSYYTLNSSGSQLTLGGQNFSEVDCNQNPDVTFQFAYLSPEQKSRLGDISKVIGLTVRTDYDLKNLKGKGFLYVAQDSQFVSHPWSTLNGLRLLPVLVHEIGHIFGVQHMSDVMFMADDYPATLIDRNQDNSFGSFLKYLAEGGLENIRLFKYSTSSFMHFNSCHSSGVSPKPPSALNFMKNPKLIKKNQSITQQQNLSVYQTFFGRKAIDNCESYNIGNNIFEFNSGKDETQVVGRAQLVQQSSTDLSMMPSNRFTVVNFWFPKEQNVFPNLDENLIQVKTPITFFIPKVVFKGEYKTLDGKVKRQLILEVLNSGAVERMSGVLDGILYNDLQLGF